MLRISSIAMRSQVISRYAKGTGSPQADAAAFTRPPKVWTGQRGVASQRLGKPDIGSRPANIGVAVRSCLQLSVPQSPEARLPSRLTTLFSPLRNTCAGLLRGLRGG